MVWRRFAVVTAVVVGILLPTPADADEVPTCTLAPPPRISISAESMPLQPVLSGTCRESPDGYARWELPITDFPWEGFAAELGFNPVYGDYGGITDNVVLGTVTWLRVGAGTHWYGFHYCQGSDDPPGCDMNLHEVQNNPQTTIKLGSSAWLAGRRTGSTVTLRAFARVWSPTHHAFVADSALGVLQVKDADGTWRRLGNAFTTDADGRRTITVSLAGPHTVRYATYPTRSSWSAVSAPLTR